MGFIKNSKEKQGVDTAQKAWDEDRRGFVLRVQTMTSNKDEHLTAALDGALSVGWQLKSTAATFNTTGINTEVVFFTFVRPAP